MEAQFCIFIASKGFCYMIRFTTMAVGARFFCVCHKHELISIGAVAHIHVIADPKVGTDELGSERHLNINWHLK